MTKTSTTKAYRAEWQRRWRQNADKIGATLYLTRVEIDVLDWLAEQLIANDAESTHVVGRPAAVRMLLEQVMEEHGEAIQLWAENAAEPAERSQFYKQELGRRRRGPRHDEFKSLPREQQQAQARAARKKAMAKHREKNRQRQEAMTMHLLNTDDPDR